MPTITFSPAFAGPPTCFQRPSLGLSRPRKDGVVDVVGCCSSSFETAATPGSVASLAACASLIFAAKPLKVKA
jgi:hypothetical protein